MVQNTWEHCEGRSLHFYVALSFMIMQWLEKHTHTRLYVPGLYVGSHYYQLKTVKCGALSKPQVGKNTFIIQCYRSFLLFDNKRDTFTLQTCCNLSDLAVEVSSSRLAAHWWVAVWGQTRGCLQECKTLTGLAQTPRSSQHSSCLNDNDFQTNYVSTINHSRNFNETYWAL